MKHLQTFGQLNESVNADDLWLSILTKFLVEFYLDYEEDTADDYKDADEVESNQTKYKNTGGTYDQSFSFDDALTTFKNNLTKEEADMIEISRDEEEYADVEDHDDEKEFSTIKLKRKLSEGMKRYPNQYLKDPIIHDGKAVDPKKIAMFDWEPKPNQDDEFLKSRVDNWGEVYAVTDNEGGNKEVIVILKDPQHRMGFIRQMQAYFPGFGATNFR